LQRRRGPRRLFPTSSELASATPPSAGPVRRKGAAGGRGELGKGSESGEGARPRLIRSGGVQRGSLAALRGLRPVVRDRPRRGLADGRPCPPFRAGLTRTLTAAAVGSAAVRAACVGRLLCSRGQPGAHVRRRGAGEVDDESGSAVGPSREGHIRKDVEVGPDDEAEAESVRRQRPKRQELKGRPRTLQPPQAPPRPRTTRVGRERRQEPRPRIGEQRDRIVRQGVMTQSEIRPRETVRTVRLCWRWWPRTGRGQRGGEGGRTG